MKPLHVCVFALVVLMSLAFASEATAGGRRFLLPGRQAAFNAGQVQGQQQAFYGQAVQKTAFVKVAAVQAPVYAAPVYAAPVRTVPVYAAPVQAPVCAAPVYSAPVRQKQVGGCAAFFSY